jgi:hypothetical protein
VRYLRFGGRKLAYKLINSQGFEIRFRYDDPIFYFRHLPLILSELCPGFVLDFGPLISLISSMGTVASNPGPADRELLRMDHFRAFYGHAGNYWPENPLQLEEHD